METHQELLDSPSRPKGFVSRVRITFKHHLVPEKRAMTIRRGDSRLQRIRYGRASNDSTSSVEWFDSSCSLKVGVSRASYGGFVKRLTSVFGTMLKVAANVEHVEHVVELLTVHLLLVWRSISSIWILS